MRRSRTKIDTVRASRAGHTFHERWAARRALQLVFPKDNLFAVVVEGLSPNDPLKLGKEAEDIADLILFYGDGDTFDTCSSQQILQFKYKATAEPVTSSYLKKTIKKFAATLRNLRKQVTADKIAQKLSFGFVTNAEFSVELWDAISCLKDGSEPKTNSAKTQLRFLKAWCQEEKVKAVDIFPLIDFRASTSDLPSQNRSLRRTVSDWSANSTGQAAKRLFALVELIREKAQIEGQNSNSIRREDVLDALECDEDQLFPAETRFIDVGPVVERSALQDVKHKLELSDLPVFLCADGGVGKTVFIQNLATCLSDTYEVVVFDCFAGGEYRSETQERHAPRVGLLQIINEFATRGLCDPLLSTDSDQYALIKIARKRLKQASDTVRNQSESRGILIVLDAADNAQIEADTRNEVAFPRLLLASLSEEPIDGVKLLLTSRPGPNRMDSVIGKSCAEVVKLKPFSKEESRRFLEMRRGQISNVEFSTAFARSRGNARVLEYLVESWDTNIIGTDAKTEITVDELIAQKCNKIFRNLHAAGWSDAQIREFFAALSLLPPPIPLTELAQSLGWSKSEVNSAASDLAPMLELVKHGVMFRDEPTETYIKDHYAREEEAQQSIAQRLQARQKESLYAAEALPHFLVVIADSDRAYELANSDDFPTDIDTDYGRRRLKLARLHAAFSLATRERDLDRVLVLSMQLSQAASANARGDQFIRRSPALAMILGDADVSRRLFNDRSGWRGARDTRLIVGNCFEGELDEARIHQNRAIGWINWYLKIDDETKRIDQQGYEAFDIAAVMFLNVLSNDLYSFNRNIQLWRFKFALSIVEELLTMCAQHEAHFDSRAIERLVQFAASKKCLSLALQIGILTGDYGLSHRQLKAVSRAASGLSHKYQKKVSRDSSDYRLEVQDAIASAAMTSIIVNSRQSAERLGKLQRRSRPSSYDYNSRYGASRVWSPVQAACISAWSAGRALSFHDLIPEDVKQSRKTKLIGSEADLRKFLEGQVVSEDPHNPKQREQTKRRRKQFAEHEVREIVESISCILQLIKPIEAVVLSGGQISKATLKEFIDVWISALRPEVHWNAETGRDNMARSVGIGIARTLLRHSVDVEKKDSEALIKIVSENRFSLGEKLDVLALVARRSTLADVAGAYAKCLADDILQDEYIEQRGGSYAALAKHLLPMSTAEAQEYYRQGLAQLDQMGGDDFDLIYSALHYAADQPGGHMKPHLSHRLMNLCQTIFHAEPSKFAWMLFGQAASSSIGFPAIYKLIRWFNQDVVDYSYGLPQLACFLAKAGRLDPRRAAVLLTLCEDQGWHAWQVGNGLNDLLSVSKAEDREAIFSLVVRKLESEHSFGGSESLWKSVLDCVDSYDEVESDYWKARLLKLQKAARRERIIEDEKYDQRSSSTDRNMMVHKQKRGEKASEEAFDTIIANFDPASAASLDAAVQEIQANELLRFEHKQRFFESLRDNCPYEKRLACIEALCESTELSFDSALDHIILCVDAWRSTTRHVLTKASEFIRTLFSFKGSELFDLRYSGIPRQIDRLSRLCGDPKFVMELVLETIVKERLELGGDEWLQIATSLSQHTDSSTALSAFENLLASPAARTGDEIGEGEYHTAYGGKDSDADVVADVIWHLLGDEDAFVRWHAARSIESLLEVGLVEDVKLILDRFDVCKNAALTSKEHNFSYMNAQLWLLMGLSRAAAHQGEKLKALEPQLAVLASTNDLHAVNMLHLARCLTHLRDGPSGDAEITQLWCGVKTPLCVVVENESWPKSSDRRLNFEFDYEFDKQQVSEFTRLFCISKSEASDLIADEVVKRFPSATSMTDFPGGVRYKRGPHERYESYREHIQKHALIHAITELAKSKPVVRARYDEADRNPWWEFLKEHDVSFDDGSWLADHKDAMAGPAKEHLLGIGTGNKGQLLDRTALFEKIGLAETSDQKCLPLYGHWKSREGVYVRIISALTKRRGAVGKCSELSKKRYHDIWLPMFDQDGNIDSYTSETPFEPLIWEPSPYPIGIDESDEWAASGAIARPRLGIALSNALALVSDSDSRQWSDANGALALSNQVWGEWKTDPDNYKHMSREEGAILWAESDWLEQALKSLDRSLVFAVTLSRYKSYRSYEDSSGMRETYVGLRQFGNPIRFWRAKAASGALG
ncbi:MAG: hypothetical protein JJ954_03390 [Hyphomonas sp.]|uniref:hypothetical protein n=1 Tax=Hyphomonas sp. TaxID=87 RepID=UPI001B14E98A|nr:hypothetical protein [Hyphomonas sp.]MBO6581984.1 hypothetical protein [Hyphomonas sp.]